NGELDNTTSDNLLTLREAILLVNKGGVAQLALGRSLTAGEQAQITGALGSHDTVQFNSSINGKTIALAGSELLISRSVVISGPGASNLKVSGKAASRVINIASAVSVSMEGMVDPIV